MSIQTGDTVTIRRGKNAGQSGKVTALGGGKVVLEMPDGDFQVQTETNVKAPDVPTINADDLAQIILDNDDGAGGVHFDALLNALERALPGFRKAYDNAGN